jgi:hypothetical protein
MQGFGGSELLLAGGCEDIAELVTSRTRLRAFRPALAPAGLTQGKRMSGFCAAWEAREMSHDEGDVRPHDAALSLRS